MKAVFPGIDVGRFDQALGDLRRAVELDRSRGVPWQELGEIEARLGRHEEAITAFRLAAERNPRHPRVNVLIGDAYEKKGGALQFVVSEIRLRNQFGDPVCEMKTVVVVRN